MDRMCNTCYIPGTPLFSLAWLAALSIPAHTERNAINLTTQVKLQKTPPILQHRSNSKKRHHSSALYKSWELRYSLKLQAVHAWSPARLIESILNPSKSILNPSWIHLNPSWIHLNPSSILQLYASNTKVSQPRRAWAVGIIAGYTSTHSL